MQAHSVPLWIPLNRFRNTHPIQRLDTDWNRVTSPWRLIRNTDLCKRVLNLFKVDREVVSGITIINPKFDEFVDIEDGDSQSNSDRCPELKAALDQAESRLQAGPHGQLQRLVG